MAEIDQVIAAARQPGAMSVRKQFTVARARAMRKMREFALADPHYFALELVQAAVANGAEFIDIACGSDDFVLSYVGGVLLEEELAQLLDFLFASKDDVEHGHLRLLALGINALMLFEPKEVSVESGDGTHGGTTRAVLRRRSETLELGRPEQPLKGTYVRVMGLRRRKVAGKSSLRTTELGPPEVLAIEERCLTTPVPVLVNDRPLFGFSSVRSPVLLGWDRQVRVDEGDLYGTLGIVPDVREVVIKGDRWSPPSVVRQTEPTRSLKLLTYGVWIKTVEAVRLQEHQLGGVICFDRLRKTADHSGIVQDDRYEEMLARLRPYIHRLLPGGEARDAFSISRLGEDPLEPKALRELLRSVPEVVVVPAETDPASREGGVAAGIGEVLGATVLAVPEEDRSLVRVLGREDLRVVDPGDLTDATLAFYASPAHRPPPRPWLTAPVELPPMEAEGIEGTTQATVYTPERPLTGPGRLRVQVVTTDRLVWEGDVATAFPGHVLQVDLPPVSPALLGVTPGSYSTPEGVLRDLVLAVARKADGALEEATRRVLATLPRQTVRPGSTAAQMALAAVARHAVPRLRTQGLRSSSSTAPRASRRPARKAPSGGVPASPSSIGNAAGGDGSAPECRSYGCAGPESDEVGVAFAGSASASAQHELTVPVVETLAGEALSVADLAARLPETWGFVYGTVPEVPPNLEGLDASRILRLDGHEERLLLAIFGEGAYVRIDAREVLASHGRVYRGVECRDLALGLRDYPDFPLLVEGVDPTAWGPERRSAALADLLTQLGRRLLAPPRAEDEAAGPDPEECRRHACRHLQWFLCRSAAAGGDDLGTGLAELPLFLDADGRAWAFTQVQRALSRPEGVVAHYARAFSSHELSHLAAAARERAGAEAEAPDDLPGTLLVDPFLYRLLQPLGRLRPAFDFDLTEEEAARSRAAGEAGFLVSTEVDEAGLRGVVGVPTERLDAPAVAVVEEATRRTVAVRSTARRYGVVGLVRAEGEVDEGRADAIRTVLDAAARRCLSGLAARLPQLAETAPGRDRMATELLAYLGRHLTLYAAVDGTMDWTVYDDLARDVAALPLFPSGGGAPLTAQRLAEEFCAFGTARAAALLAEDAPEWATAWVATHLDPAEVVKPASRRLEPAAAERPSPTPDEDSVAATLESWLRALRPDRDPELEGGQTRIELVDRDDEGQRLDVRRGADPFFYDAGEDALYVDGAHRLVTAAREGGEGDALSWLLLACYAHLNELLDPVTNEHELAFQRRVAEALGAGRL